VTIVGKGVDAYLKANPKELNRFAELDFNNSGLYAGQDSYYTRGLFKKQRRLIKTKGLTDAYRLLHEGSIALAHMEYEGIRVDVPYMNVLHKQWEGELAEHKNILLTCKVAKDFERSMGRPIKYNKQTSNDDLRVVLFDILGLESLTKTKKKQVASIDEKTLLYYEDVSEFISSELKARKLQTRLGYLEGYMKYEVDGFLHPSFNLDIARSYRSSASEPNLQNVIHRDEEGVVIRKCIIPRKGNCIYEVDYGAMEVRIIACWSKDGKLIQFILDDFDMHGYWAEIIFGIKDKNAIQKKKYKVLRYTAKNQFIFPLFYGSYWRSITKNIWGIFDNIGYKYNGTFDQWEVHIKKCEDEFWRMFSGVRDRQFDAVDEYKSTGLVKMIGWGLERHGYMSRNVIFNSHIQGPAFLCLLWSIIERDKIRDKFRTKMCSQVHDSIFFDGPEKEEGQHIQVVDEIMMGDIREANPWIIVPLITEWEKGDNWFEMKAIK